MELVRIRLPPGLSRTLQWLVPGLLLLAALAGVLARSYTDVLSDALPAGIDWGSHFSKLDCVHEGVQSGEGIPRWCTSYYAGMPVLAVHPPLAYALATQLSLLLGVGTPAALKLLVEASLLLAVLAFYLLARAVGAGPWAAGGGALAFSLHPLYFHQVLYYGQFAGIVALPFALLVPAFALRYPRAFPHLPALALAAVVLTHPITTLFALLLAAPLLLSFEWRRVVALGLLALALASPWLLPALLDLPHHRISAGGFLGEDSGALPSDWPPFVLEQVRQFGAAHGPYLSAGALLAGLAGLALARADRGLRYALGALLAVFLFFTVVMHLAQFHVWPFRVAPYGAVPLLLLLALGSSALARRHRAGAAVALLLIGSAAWAYAGAQPSWSNQLVSLTPADEEVIAGLAALGPGRLATYPYAGLFVPATYVYTYPSLTHYDAYLLASRADRPLVGNTVPQEDPKMLDWTRFVLFPVLLAGNPLPAFPPADDLAVLYEAGWVRWHAVNERYPQMLAFFDSRPDLFRPHARHGAVRVYEFARAGSLAEAEGCRVSHSRARERFDMRAECPAAGELRVKETWYPFWRARVNGRPAEVRRDRFGFTRVGLPAGASRVELYIEDDRRALVALALVAGAAFIVWRRARPATRGPAPRGGRPPAAGRRGSGP